MYITEFWDSSYNRDFLLLLYAEGETPCPRRRRCLGVLLVENNGRARTREGERHEMASRIVLVSDRSARFAMVSEGYGCLVALVTSLSHSCLSRENLSSIRRVVGFSCPGTVHLRYLLHAYVVIVAVKDVVGRSLCRGETGLCLLDHRCVVMRVVSTVLLGSRKQKIIRTTE